MPDDPRTKEAIRTGLQPGLPEIYPKPPDHKEPPPPPVPGEVHRKQVRTEQKQNEGAPD